MDITFLGDSGFKIKGKRALVVTNPSSHKFKKIDADIVTFSNKEDLADLGGEGTIYLTGPGEYEVKEIKVVGVSSARDEKVNPEKGKNTIFNILADGINICHLGDLGQKELTNQQMEEIGNVDVLLLPAQDSETFDAGIASKIISELEPKVVIPINETKEDEKSETLDKLFKELGAENVQPENKLTLKGDKLPEELSVVLLNKTI